MSKTIEYDDIVMETKDGGTRYTYVKIHNTLGTLSLYLNKIGRASCRERV